MIWNRALLLLICGVILGCFAAEAPAQGSSQLKLVTAKRYESYKSDPWASELRPKHPKVDVVLVLNLGGISEDEFHNVIKKRLPYLQAGGKRYEFTVFSVSAPREGPTEIVLAGAVPRQILNFTLIFGDHPPLDFAVEEAVQSNSE